MTLTRCSVTSDFIPVSTSMFLILLCLGEGERHGYALMREIFRLTEGRIRLGPSVLYGSLGKMFDLGLIETSEYRPDRHLDDERRRYYRITSRGRQVAQAEAARMRKLAKLAAAIFDED